MEQHNYTNTIEWDTMTTIKSFDLGAEEDLYPRFTSDSQHLEVISPAATTPISLLVQSLVQQLCSLLERDQGRANNLYQSICEKLHQMKLIDESYAMGEFEVMRSQYQRALYQLVSVAKGTELPISLPIPITQPTGLDWSRYLREFEELYFIAGGGFGSVFKARHRLDGVEYAVKKVCIKSSNINSIMNHLSEVKTFASLSHSNIVSYKAAWLEPLIEKNVKKPKHNFKIHSESNTQYSTTHLDSKYSTHPNIMESFKTYNSRELTQNNSQSDFSIIFENSSSLSNEVLSHDDIGQTNSISEDTSEEDGKQIKLFESYMDQKYSCINLKWATLYIQMSFCQKTLKQWLEERNKYHWCGEYLCKDNCNDTIDDIKETSSSDFLIGWPHIDVVMDMFTQIANGLNYIHTRGIVHHDIKPSNIFVGNEGNVINVQLGDFGLACPLQKSHKGLAIGTHLYAAPEQLEGQCNPKSDMYSMGIILLEMVETFSTDMERVKTINDLRKGQIPAHLTASYPKIAHIIGKLVQRRPTRRLDSNQLLMELKLLKENKDETIKSLKEELAVKDDEIAKLKMMLANMRNSP